MPFPKKIRNSINTENRVWQKIRSYLCLRLSVCQGTSYNYTLFMLLMLVCICISLSLKMLLNEKVVCASLIMDGGMVVEPIVLTLWKKYLWKFNYKPTCYVNIFAIKKEHKLVVLFPPDNNTKSYFFPNFTNQTIKSCHSYILILFL